MSQLQRRFSHNITTLYRRLLIDVFFATLLQRCDMVERRRDMKTTTIQRCNDVVCLLGMLIKIFVMKFIVRLSSRLSIKFLWKLQSSQLCNNFPWPAVLKNVDLVSITDSFGNHGTNIPTVLQRSRIHDLNLLDQWVGEMQNLSGLINTIKNSPLN